MTGAALVVRLADRHMLHLLAEHSSLVREIRLPRPAALPLLLLTAPRVALLRCARATPPASCTGWLARPSPSRRSAKSPNLSPNLPISPSHSRRSAISPPISPNLPISPQSLPISPSHSRRSASGTRAATRSFARASFAVAITAARMRAATHALTARCLSVIDVDTDRSASRPSTLTRPRIAPDLPRSPQISPDLPRSPQISADHFDLTRASAGATP